MCRPTRRWSDESPSTPVRQQQLFTTGQTRSDQCATVCSARTPHSWCLPDVLWPQPSGGSSPGLAGGFPNRGSTNDSFHDSCRVSCAGFARPRRRGQRRKSPGRVRYALDGGSLGLQLGAQATDLVLLVMNERGVHALLDSKVTLGGNASAAAGPKGRDASASTDATLRAEILSYSRTRGLFVGVSLEGASLRPDNDASEQVYGRRISAHTIVTSTGISVPAAGRRFVDALEKNPPRNESQKVTRNEQ